MTARERERLTVTASVFGILVATTIPLWDPRKASAVAAVVAAAIFLAAFVYFVRLFDVPAWLRMRRAMKRRVRELRAQRPRTSDDLVDLFEREVRR